MSVKINLPPKRYILVNYFGGLGYYALHFAWIFVMFMALVRILQYVILRGEPILYAPSQTTPTTIQTTGGMDVFVSWLITIAAGSVVAVFITLLPYWLGYISRTIPRWILDQTSWHVNLTSIHRTKQSLVLLITLLSLPTLYHADTSAQANLPFFIVFGSCIFASLCFAVQHKTAASMHIHERSVY